jgi:sensor c-di-GMP phosphodiesterase-like protein
MAIVRKQQEPGLGTHIAIAAIGTLGAIAGFLLGGLAAMPVAEIHLRQYLHRVAVQEDNSVNEARNLLAGQQNSGYAPCSDAELARFREMVFRSEFLRDVGRMERGRINCSATAWRPLQAIGQFQAGRAVPDGTTADSGLVPIRDESLKATGIEQGGIFVLFGSHLPDVQGSLPIHLAVDRNSGISSSPQVAASSAAAFAGVIADRVTRDGDMLVAEHCSSLQSSCVRASVSVNEARRGEYKTVGGATLLGAIAGIGAGILFFYLRRRRHSMDQQLRRAVAAGELHVAYQPIVNLADGKIVGAEALARWTTRDGRSVEPEVFIKVAEDHGFVGSITKFVLRRSLKEFHEVFKKIPEFRLNVNIAAADLVDPEFLPMLDQAVREAEIRPKSLVLEVTESTTANREEAMESIRDLRDRGYSIYIDDFGTGYSSLSYLLYLSVDTIKIDKAFVRAIGTESVTVAILPQILAMARSLNLGVVVEGIESARQADYFSSNHVRMYGQGFLFGRPVPASDFMQMLGLAGEQEPLVAANAASVALPSPWPQLGKGVPTAIAH